MSHQELSIGELIDVMGAFTQMNIRLPAVQQHSFTTLSVLHTLVHHGPKRLSELTASEQVTQPAITQIVTRLERDGMVERRPDPSDGRAVLVHMTEQGAAVVRSRQADRMVRMTELADQLTLADRTAIQAALPALIRLVELHHRTGDE